MREIRSGGQLEVRNDNGTVHIEGYAAVFNSFADIGGMFREQIAPGAFRKTLADKADVRLLINHEGLPLARTKSSTLELREDDQGLLINADLDSNDPDVSRLVPKLRRGDVNQMSFAFSPMKQEWDINDEPPIRTIKEAKLFDVSVVTFPAYDQTSVALRHLDHAGVDWARLEAILLLQSRGLPLTDDDHNLIADVLTTLSGLLPRTSEPEIHSDDRSDSDEVSEPEPQEHSEEDAIEEEESTEPEYHSAPATIRQLLEHPHFKEQIIREEKEKNSVSEV